MTRNEPEPEASPVGGSTPEENGSAYECVADVLPAKVGPFGAGWKPEVGLLRLDDMFGLWSEDVRYEDFLRDHRPH
ncbi:hypothetical protein [Curtobacterium sp. AB7]|uniref:hypothetical protein n=1 Tax=Curtobacterium sp. AB7 TaxID=3349327 RepID=UPI0038342141